MISRFHDNFPGCTSQKHDMQICNHLLIAQVVTELVQSVAPIPPGIQERKQDVDTYCLVYNIYMIHDMICDKIMVKISFFITSIQKRMEHGWEFIKAGSLPVAS